MVLPRALSLVETGLTLGIFHVLTGPDHLSAIATLSANVPSRLQAFWLGVRWGIGHSTGLLLVGIVLILVTSNSSDDHDASETIDMSETASTVFESLVGVFMLILGAYGIRRAWSKRPKHGQSSSSYRQVGAPAEDIVRDPKIDVEAKNLNLDTDADGVSSVEILDYPCSYHNHFGASHGASHDGSASNSPEEHIVESSSPPGLLGIANSLIQRVSTGSMALIAGIFHGMAGPGGVLGVIPAVQLRNGALACIYLSSFCLSSTLTMGVFATLYGSLTSSQAIVGSRGASANREFWIESLSATLSVLVGIAWLVLVSMGKLDDVFP